jgi:hypothetical protein
MRLTKVAAFSQFNLTQFGNLYCVRRLEVARIGTVDSLGARKVLK